MSDDWTPTTEGVRAGYAYEPDSASGYDPEMGDRFDRWLAQHGAEVAEARTRDIADWLGYSRSSDFLRVVRMLGFDPEEAGK